MSAPTQLLQYRFRPTTPQNTFFTVSYTTASTFSYDTGSISTPSTSPSNRAVAPFLAARAVSLYSDSTLSAFATAALVFWAASVAMLAASLAILAAAAAVDAAVSAFFADASATAAEALATAAASSAGFDSSFSGALTTVSPLMAGRLTTPSSVLTASSSSTLWLSVFIWFTTSWTSSFFSSSVSAIVIRFYCFSTVL